jgi:hypothetical protein
MKLYYATIESDQKVGPKAQFQVLYNPESEGRTGFRVQAQVKALEEDTLTELIDKLTSFKQSLELQKLEASKTPKKKTAKKKTK